MTDRIFTISKLLKVLDHDFPAKGRILEKMVSDGKGCCVNECRNGGDLRMLR